jgi:glycosyltransferase involved in cell wall biosynthesis
MIPEIIKNGENGYISNDPAQLRQYVNKLLSDEKLATELGMAARETVINNFSLDSFVNKWNEVFIQCVKQK